MHNLDVSWHPIESCVTVLHCVQPSFPEKGCKVYTAERCPHVPWKQPTLLGSKYKQMYFAFSTVRCCTGTNFEKIGSVFGCLVMQWIFFKSAFKNFLGINLEIKLFNYIFSEHRNQMCEAEGEKSHFHENFFVSL